MRFEIEAAGRIFTVAVDASQAAMPGAPLAMTIDGEPATIDARRTAEGYSLIVGGRVIDAGISDGAARGEIVVHLPSVSVPVSIDASRRRGRTAAHAQGVQRITAPMPGRIVRVLVKPGDLVELRQPIIVVEAMKMENELRAPKAGTVKDVAAAPGDSVEAGRLLIVIE
jgi:biotin carboxyl carrier protein